MKETNPCKDFLRQGTITGKKTFLHLFLSFQKKEITTCQLSAKFQEAGRKLVITPPQHLKKDLTENLAMMKKIHLYSTRVGHRDTNRFWCQYKQQKLESIPEFLKSTYRLPEHQQYKRE